MKKESLNYRIILLLIIIAGVVLCIYQGFQKKGFYIDEYYTFTRANGTGIGIAVDVGEWNTSDSYISQLVSEGSENFNFAQAYENCGFHPVVYHYMLHFVSSIFEGTFSKWLGIGLNIILYIIMLVLAADILLNITDKDKKITAIGLFAAAFSPCVVSGVMFIRMYMGLALFAMWYLYLHIHDLKRDKLSVKRFLLPIVICGFLGFLTMYYFVIFMFLTSFFYCFYLFFCCKRYKDTIVYGLSAMLSLVLSYLYMPECIYYIFKAEHGKSRKVANNLISTKGIGKRLVFFYNLVNEHVFGGFLPVFIVALVIGIAVIFITRKKYGSIKELPYRAKCMILAGCPAVIYLLLMVKMTEKASDTTHRYCYIIYPIFVLLMAAGIYMILERYKKQFKYPYVITALLMLLVLAFAYKGNQVLYLFPEAAEGEKYIEQYKELPAVVLERDDGRIDALIKELMMFDETYFAVIDKPETVIDDKISEANSLLVFVDDKADKDEALKLIFDQNESLSSADFLWNAGSSFDVYLLH